MSSVSRPTHSKYMISPTILAAQEKGPTACVESDLLATAYTGYLAEVFKL